MVSLDQRAPPPQQWEDLRGELIGDSTPWGGSLGVRVLWLLASEKLGRPGELVIGSAAAAAAPAVDKGNPVPSDVVNVVAHAEWWYPETPLSVATARRWSPSSVRPFRHRRRLPRLRYQYRCSFTKTAVTVATVHTLSSPQS